KKKSFKFCYDKNDYAVICETSMTIQEALHTNASFQEISARNQQKVKNLSNEMIIKRRTPLAATVTPDFPVCLIDENETLDIKFKTVDRVQKSTPKNTPPPPALMAERGNFVSFYISRTGGDNIQYILQNSRLTETSYICVYALKRENVEAALRRDGRFKEKVFQKGILKEESSKTLINLSDPVDVNDEFSEMKFQIIINPNKIKGQMSTQKDKNLNDSDTSQATNFTQASTNAEEKKIETLLKENESRKYTEIKEIPETQEILNLLREQHRDLVKTLKERENLKNDGEVKRFFRVEYDKSVQSFLEVNRVKKLIKRSGAICLIRVDDFINGTGFLLFKRFVLTNEHVVKEYDCDTLKLEHSLRAVFGYEDVGSPVNEISVKENCVALLKGKDDMGNYLDFALLELSRDVQLPELLKYWRNITSPIRGGVCIIGHPGGGVKQMDPCFIIPKEDIPQAAETHYTNNPKDHVIHVITKWCLAEDRELRESQIMYNSCFLHGSSGSPVFDDFCNLTGVHTGGYDYEEVSGESRSVMEYGLPLFPILVQIFIQCSQRGRSDVVQHFECQQNLKYVLQVANKQLQEDIRPPNDRFDLSASGSESVTLCVYTGAWSYSAPGEV
ncbi:protein FAM, partial [Clarias magur]